MFEFRLTMNSEHEPHCLDLILLLLATIPLMFGLMLLNFGKVFFDFGIHQLEQHKFITKHKLTLEE